MEGHFLIGTKEIRFQCLRDGMDGIEMRVAVDDPEDASAVAEAVQREFLRRAWAFTADMRGETLRECVRLMVAPERPVVVYNFMPRPLAGAEIEVMGRALHDFHAHLRTEDLWTLTSIRIRPRDEMNGVNGTQALGRAHADQGHVEIFPAAFAEEAYRGAVPCTTLRAVLQHEAAHVCLDKVLIDAWDRHLARLGWEITEPGVLVRLPGGRETRFFRRDWRSACTPYAAFLPMEDRAESAFCMLNDPGRLDALRRTLLAEVFLPGPRKFGGPDFQMLRPELPRITQPVLVALERHAAERCAFHEIMEEFAAMDDLRVVDLEEYRRQRTAA